MNKFIMKTEGEMYIDLKLVEEKYKRIKTPMVAVSIMEVIAIPI